MTNVTKKVNKECHGLFRLFPKAEDAYDPNDFQVDIVAVHGLMGDAFTTWTHDDGHLWLRDSLPDYVPKSRIMTYGYDASVAFTTSRATITDFAIDLATRLNFERGHSVERNRPIIFISHSLGGIVFKEFLITIFLQGEEFEHLKNSVHGVIFLGCPHRGSSAAPYFELLSRFVNLATFGQGVRTNLIQALKASSEQLRKVSQQAVHRLAPLRIVSCYETRVTFQAHVVQEESARLDLPNERALSLDANHLEISKFSPSSPQLYFPVWNFVKNLVEESTASAAACEDNRCLLNSLTSLDFKLSQIRPNQPQGNTCNWIFRNSTYKKWLNQDQPSMLILTGQPGCGKSVITRHVADVLPNGGPDQSGTQYLGVAYFCSYVEAALDSEAMLLRSLLHQLVQLNPASGARVRSCLKANHADNGMAFDLTSTKLWGALFDVLALDTMTHVCLVIDAIDELGSDIARAVIQKLSRAVKFLECGTDSAKSASRLRLFISSRQAFSDIDVNHEHICVEKADVKADIRTYLDGVLGSFAQQQNAFNMSISPSLRQDIVNRIREASNGIFLVAVLSWENFRKGTEWCQDLVLKKLDSVMPLMSDMRIFYDKMLAKVNKKTSEAQIVFSILAAAARPLTKVEIETLVGLCLTAERPMSSADIFRIDDLLLFMEENYPGLLTVHENKTVTLIHKSLKDYLETRHSTRQKFQTDRRHITRACLQYLMLTDLIQDARAGLTRRELTKQYPLLDYASDFFLWHIRDIPVEDPLWLLFADTAQEYSIYTLETLQPKERKRFAKSPLLFVLEELPSAPMRSLISRFSTHGYNLDETWHDWNCGRPLQYCCAESSSQSAMLSAALLLLDLGANPSLPRNAYKSNIVRALETGVDALYRRLLRHPMTRVGDRDAKDRGLLHTLIEFGSMGQIDALFNSLHAVDVNIQDNAGSTPLHDAILASREDAVRLLLQIPGIRVDVTDHKGRTPLALATYWGLSRMALAVIGVLDNSPAAQNDQLNALLDATTHGQKELSTRLLQGCGYQNLGSQTDVSGKGLIHRLAMKNWSAVLEECIRLANPPFSINLIDHSGRTALHYAASLGNTESCRVLVEAGADLRLQDRNGMTVAQTAASSGFKDTLVLLLQAEGVDANQRDHLGRNLVHWAATLDCTKLMDLLSQRRGVNWTQRDNYGKRPVDIAYICESKNVGLFLSRKLQTADNYDWDAMYSSPAVVVPSATNYVEPHVSRIAGDIKDDGIDYSKISENPSEHAMVLRKRSPSPEEWGKRSRRRLDSSDL